MKRLIALALSVLMIFTCFVGCKDKANDNLANAVAYLENMYPEATKEEPQVIGSDKDVLSVVTVDGVAYDVEWAITVTEGAADSVKIAESETENCVKIDIPDLTETDILFTATATVKDEKDNTATAEFLFKVKGVELADDTDVETILNDAYALEEGAKMESEVTLTGVITSVDTPYSAQYKNVTVTIAIQGFEDKPIKCYRLAGEGADTLAVGDTITVTGVIANYQGTIEFEQGCIVKSITKADNATGDNPSTDAPTTSTPTQTTPNTPSTSTPSTTELKLVTDEARILKDAFALGKNETTPYIAQLTGKVISITKEYNEQYGSITAIITVGGKNVTCYNMKVGNVSGGSKLKAGDTITVKGVIKNFYYDEADTSGTVEFTWDEASQTEVVLTKLVVGKEETKTLNVVDNPVVGTAYKFGFLQTKKNAVYYAVGGMNGYYMSTSTSSAVAIDVYLENANGGYYVYAMIDGKKKYLDMQQTADGKHINAVYVDAPSIVFTYDTTKKTLVAERTKNGETSLYAFGTYGDYVTIGCTDTAKEGYECHFYQ